MSPRTRSGNRRTSTSGPPLASTSKLLVEDSGDPLSPEDSDEDDTNILTSSIKVHIFYDHKHIAQVPQHLPSPSAVSEEPEC